jgi:TRAP-type C4-dicarboxylate transport system permease small subunit
MKNRILRILTILLMFLAAGLYHAHGMNDWFSPTTVSGDITLTQAANEIIAAVNIAAGCVMVFIEMVNAQKGEAKS